MDRATFDRESAIHQKLYELLRDQIKRDHAGRYVALAQGRLVAVADTFDEAKEAVERLRPEYYVIFPADVEPIFEPFYDYGGEVTDRFQTCSPGPAIASGTSDPDRVQ